MYRMKVVFFGMLGAWLAVAGCHTSSAPTAGNSQGIPLRVAAASDLRPVLEAVRAALAQRQSEIQLEPVYGSSGQLYTQITQGALFDLYLSADASYTHKLVEQGLALPDSEFLYARGQLVLWARRDSPLSIQTQGMDVLRDPRVKKIAIAHPDHAPYGRAAVAALRHFGLYEQVEPRLARADNVAQAFQFVESGAADVGIVSLSLVCTPPMNDAGRLWLVPPESYPPLIQGGVILRTAQRPEAAWQLRQFLLSEQGQAILRQFGFLPAEEP